MSLGVSSPAVIASATGNVDAATAKLTGLFAIFNFREMLQGGLLEVFYLVFRTVFGQVSGRRFTEKFT